MIISNLTEARPELKTEILDVPELGEGAQIILREFTADAASEFNEALIRNKMEISTTAPEGSNIRQLVMFYCSLICCTAVNEKGERISDFKQAAALARAWDEALILRVGGVAADLNGFSAGKAEELKKDLPPNQQPQ